MDEIKITPAMIDAGANAAWKRLRHILKIGEFFPADELAAEVYRAMALVKEAPPLLTPAIMTKDTLTLLANNLDMAAAHQRIVAALTHLFAHRHA